MTRPRPAGFTLLEVIIAIAIAVGLMLVALTLYSEAAAIRGTTQRVAEEAQLRRTIMDMISDDLVAGVGRINGGTHTVATFLRLPPGPEQWQGEDGLEVEPTGVSDGRMVRYHLRYEEVEFGDPIIVGLARSTRATTPLLLPEEDRVVHSHLLTRRIRFLHLRYFDGATWHETWSGRTRPAAIEIILGPQPLPEEMLPEDYPWPTWNRTVALPMAEVKQGGIDDGFGLEGGGL